MAALNFTAADMYPGMGYLTTREITQPEAEDQMAMTDSESVAKANPKVAPATNKSIWLSIAIVLGIFIVLSMK